MLEETGAGCSIKRFLGCLEYSFEHGYSSICHNHEYNLVFEVISNNLKRNIAIPKLEEHIELLWMPLSDMDKIDFRAEPLRKLIPKWLSEKNNVFESMMI